MIPRPLPLPRRPADGVISSAPGNECSNGSGNLRRQKIVLAVMLAGAVGVSAYSQVTARAAATIPDFSGRFGRNSFNFEPVPNGPQPVVNLSRMPDGTSNI